MSVHLTYRGTGVSLRTSSTSDRDSEAALVGGAGTGSTTTPTGQSFASDQVVVRVRGDAPTEAGAIEVSVDGGTTYNAVPVMSSGARCALHWTAGARGKPGLNADIQNAAESTRMVTDPDFEILGTNASSDDVTFNAEGGIKVETDGADGDEVILLPHLDANQSAWTQWTWGTDKQVRWSCDIETGASIDNCIIWAGLKLTNTEVTATDDDQAFFRYENGVNDGEWQAVSSVGGTDDAHDTGVVVATTTRYRLEIAIDSSRVARFYINGTLVETSAALTDATDLIPYIGVAADGAAETKVLVIYGQTISRAAG